MNKNGLGKQLEVKYIIETTGKDEYEDVMNYSNIKQMKRNTLEEALELINTYQSAGYHNINLMLQVNHGNEWLIEDSTNRQLEFTINSNHAKQIAELKKHNEAMHEEMKVFNDFIKQYKAEKMYNEFKAKYTSNTSNKDENNLYWYEMLYRPLSPFCQPKNHIKYDDSQGRHGIIAYNRPLDQNELDEYELREWDITA